MSEKDPKDMTASELLRLADSHPCSMCRLVMAGDARAPMPVSMAGEGVVRCKDCAHGTLSHQFGVLVVECRVMRSYNRPDGYCHLGERRDDGR